MHMSWLARQREVFDQVAELAPPQRDAALVALCDGDTDLHDAVRSLLTARDLEQAILDRPATVAGVEELLGEVAAMHAMPVAGQRLGSFVLRELLGEGGMGAVYLAEQDSPRRTVAIKLLRSPVMTRGMVARFEREAAALARLRHPGIAQIYEAGTLDAGQGRQQPYYAMEFVPGPDLLTYARSLSSREKLELFAKVCDAVQHAHVKGVIHRDIKPANIIVDTAESTGTRHTGTQPKVLDFGIAMLEDSDDAVTSAGQVIGTLPYMSPEQLRGERVAIDTRSDVYSLGVVLYELLTGSTPIDLKGLSIAAAARKVESTDPAKLPAHLQGDVQTIVGKALEKQPDRRYQSAAEFADDVRRYLADHPITARPATAMYTLSKFAKRHRAIVIATGCVTAATILGAAGLSIGLIQAKRSQHEAERLAHEASAAALDADLTADFLSRTLAAVRPVKSETRELTVREMLEAAEARLPELAKSPRAELRTRMALADGYISANECEPALSHAKRACELAVSEFGEVSQQHAQSLDVMGRIFQVCETAGDAIDVKERALATWLQITAESSVEVALARQALAASLQDAGRLREARQSLELARPILIAEKHRSATAATAQYAHLISTLDGEAGERRALEVLTLALADLRASHDDPALEMQLLFGMGRIYWSLRSLPEAEAVLREALAISDRLRGRDEPITLSVRREFAAVLRDLGKLQESLDESKAIVEVTRRVYGDKSKLLIAALSELGKAFDAVGDHTAAAHAFAQAAERAEAIGSPPFLVASLSRAGEKFEDAGDYEQSRDFTLRAMAALGEGSTHADVSLALQGRLARLQYLQGEKDAGMRAMETAMQAYRDAHIADASLLATMMTYAQGLQDAGDAVAAHAMWTDALALANERKRPVEVDACEAALASLAPQLDPISTKKD